MGYAIKSGAKIIGKIKRKSQEAINRVLAKQYRKEKKVSILKIKKKGR